MSTATSSPAATTATTAASPSPKQVIDAILKKIEDRNMPEFHQAVQEVLHKLLPVMEKKPELFRDSLLERLVEPERVIQFRVVWQKDDGSVQVNTGWRIQFNSAIGVYKGGLRFHESVNFSILSFLGFEQTFKNSLTGLALGGAKGGSNLNTHGLSDNEVMRFCQSFMTELSKHIDHNVDVPAGDIGVGAREIGYLYGAFKRLRNTVTPGILTGKDISFGGSLIRPEATGYGLVYFTQEMLKSSDKGDLKGRTVVVSGSGNVAQHAAEKAIALGAKVIAMSDSNGVIYDKDGITDEKLKFIMELKNVKRGRIAEYKDKFGGENVEYIETGGKQSKGKANPIWAIKCDIALPCATQNELNEEDAKKLVENGVTAVVEGANMPCTPEAIAVLQNAKIPFAPGKASNAGGVATSGLEMSQNSARLSWTREEVDKKLHEIMVGIHKKCVAAAKEFGPAGSDYVDYVLGANVAGFLKVATAMQMEGLV